jgi:DNA-binding transcriptional LysR family regulator
MDYLTSLRVFRAVVEQRSFVAAAAALGLSRAAVSKHVAALEARIGTRLLQRNPRSVHCTESGAAFFLQTGSALDALERAELEAARGCTEPRGTLRASAPLALALRHLAPHMADFRAAYPLLTLDLRLTHDTLALVEEGVDVALWFAPALPASRLVARELARCAQVVCGAPAYFAGQGRPATPEDLVHHACLRCTTTPGEWAFAGSHSIAVEGTFRSESLDLVRAAALAGAGIAQLPAFAVYDDLRSGALEPVLQDWTLPECGVHAVYPSRRHLSAKVRAFIDFFAVKLRDASGLGASGAATRPAGELAPRASAATLVA